MSLVGASLLNCGFCFGADPFFLPPRGNGKGSLLDKGSPLPGAGVFVIVFLCSNGSGNGGCSVVSSSCCSSWWYIHG